MILPMIQLFDEGIWHSITFDEQMGTRTFTTYKRTQWWFEIKFTNRLIG